MRIGVTEILLILAIVLVIFGGGKIAGVGKSLGQSIREFKKEVNKDKAGDKADDAKADDKAEAEK